MTRVSAPAAGAPFRAASLLRRLLPVLLLAACAGPLRRGGDGGYDYSMKPKENDFDRAAFGKSPLPFWMGLTAPEIRALANKEKAAAGDPAALLDLAILASGRPRSAAGYDSIHRRVEAFVARVKPSIDAEPTAYRKGLKLHRAMHAGFFPAPAQAGAPTASARAGPSGGSGYDFHQSALAPVFDGGTFNCVSSAALFVILARHFGMKASGVILPSHAFVQIETPEGKIIEVETTSPAGYDWVHDEAFYGKNAFGWFQARGLPPSTYQDYRNRVVADPLAFLAWNMNNQHTAPVRMDQEDRCRLAEARAFLADGDREAQVNRLDLYNTEFLHLKKRKDFATLETMFARITPVLAGLRRRWRDDAGMQNRLAWAYHEYAYVLHELGRHLESLPYIDSSLACVRGEEKQGPIVRGNDLALIQIIAGSLGEKKAFQEAEAALRRYPGLSKEDASFRRTEAWLYNKWAVELWNKEDWEGALAKFERQKALSTLSDRKSVTDNMANAYLNWAAGYQDQGDWPGTRRVLARCAERIPEARKCKTLLEQIMAQHNLE